MTLPLVEVFFLTEVFFPVHADSSFVGASDMSPEVHCNWCNHSYILGMPDPRPDIRCVQYLFEVHKKVPNEFEHQVEPLKSGIDIRDLKHHWMSNRYPQTSGRCQEWIQNIIRCQQWIQNITWGVMEIFRISYRCTYTWRNIKSTSWTCTWHL